MNTDFNVIAPSPDPPPSFGVRLAYPTHVFDNVTNDKADQDILSMSADFYSHSVKSLFGINVAASGFRLDAGVLGIEVLVNNRRIGRCEVYAYPEKHQSVNSRTFYLFGLEEGSKHTIQLKGEDGCHFDGNSRINVSIIEFQA